MVIESSWPTPESCPRFLESSWRAPGVARRFLEGSSRVPRGSSKFLEASSPSANSSGSLRPPRGMRHRFRRCRHSPESVARNAGILACKPRSDHRRARQTSPSRLRLLQNCKIIRSVLWVPVHLFGAPPLASSKPSSCAFNAVHRKSNKYCCILFIFFWKFTPRRSASCQAKLVSST
jgi:hypothetical protein